MIKQIRNKTKGLTLKSRLLIVTSIILTVAIIAVSMVSYKKTYTQTSHLLQRQALSIATAAAGGINKERFQSLTESLSMDDAYYEELLNQFVNINREIGVGMLYTLINIDETDYTYVVDGSETVEIGYKQTKEDFAEEVAMAFEQGKSFVSEPYYVKSLKKSYISAFVPIIGENNQVIGVVEYDYEGNDLTKSLEEFIRGIILLAVAINVVGLIIIYLYLRKAFKPMGELIEVMNKVSEGDLSIEVNTNRNDEVGKINFALQQTINSMRSMLESIKEASTHVSDTAKAIGTSTQDATVAYGELATATTDISEMTQKQAMETEKAKFGLEKLDTEAQSINLQVNDTVKIANETHENTEEGAKVIRETREQMESIEQSIAQAHTIISGFMNEMSKIQGIITTISGISEQTNLLALNASIEAARAGENGKGFAVVAGEVGKLADESNQATSEIANIIQYINGEVTSVLEAINISVQNVKEGKNYTMQTEKVFELIKASNKNLEEQISNITHAISEITNNVSDINSNMNEMEEVSKVIDAKTLNLAAVTQEQMATSEEFDSMAQVLNQEAQSLITSIEKFKIQ